MNGTCISINFNLPLMFNIAKIEWDVFKFKITLTYRWINMLTIPLLNE